MQRLKLFLPLLVFVVLAGFLWRGLALDPNAMPSALLDKPMPTFNLPTLENDTETVTEDVFTGSVTLLNVWATWCISCRVEHPYLVKLAEQGVRIIGLNYKDDSAEARKWLATLHNPYRFSIIDADVRIGLDLGVFGAPETYVVDAQGVIRYKHVGVVDERVWREKLQPIVQELAN